MKKYYFFVIAVLSMASCSKIEPTENNPEVQSSNYKENSNTTEDKETGPTKKFTFTLKGDFSTEWQMTRGYLAADGKDLTDVWVLDYDGDGNLVQQVHQTDNTAADFGKPVMNLKYGEHHVYFVASRGQDAAIDTESAIITFTKIRDTFYKDYQVDVKATSNGNRAVTLDRIVTKLKLTLTDAVASETSTIDIIPTTWYYGWNYVQAVPADAKTSQPVTISVPSSEIGNTGLTLSVYGFSTATQWTTNIGLHSKNSDSDIIGSATLSNVPFKSNRVSEFSGPLFGSEGTMTLSLNSEWDDAYEGTW
jgi:hypothetical protein